MNRPLNFALILLFSLLILPGCGNMRAPMCKGAFRSLNGVEHVETREGGGESVEFNMENS